MTASKQRISLIVGGLDHSLVIAMGVLTTAVITISCFRPITSPDFWWQLAEGQQILATLSSNQGPVGGFGLPSTPFVNEYGLYEILIAFAHSVGGMIGLRVFFGLVNILPFVLVCGIWLKYRRGFRLCYWFALALAAGLLFVRLRQRPEILGNALLVGLGLILLLRGFPTRLSSLHYVVVGTILCLWANLHSNFILGLGMVGLWALETVWRNRGRSAVFSAVCLVAVALSGVIVNPFGLQRLWHPFSLQTNFWSIAITDEMWPLPLHWYWAVGVIAAFGSYLWFSSRTGERPLWLLLMVLGTVLLALVSQRHINLFGCMMLLMLALRLQSNADGRVLEAEKRLAGVCRSVVCAGLLATLSVILLLLLRDEHEQWQRGEWTVYNQQYAPEALHELHRREPRGAPFLASIMVSAYAQGKPEYRLQPLIDTGLSRFNDTTAQFFFYLENQPPALRLALNSLDSNYVIVNEHNAHWAAVLNAMPSWSVVLTSPNGMLYQRRPRGVNDPIALQESIRSIAAKLKRERKTTAASFYTMGLLPPQDTFDLLAKAEVDWWKEPRINFLLDWLNTIPTAAREKTLARLSSENPSELRLRLLLALSLGSHNEAKSLSQSPLLAVHELEDVALRAEVNLSTDQPCASQQPLQSIFPPRRWSVRLAEVINKIRELCPLAENESPAPIKIHELVWSKDLELWMQEMSYKLNQRILTNRKPA